MAIVMARLCVGGEDRGIHPFVLRTSDDEGMSPGITSARLPPRSGSAPLDFAITTFNHVRLPSTAFLGTSLDKPDNVQLLLHQYLWRIGLGTSILPLLSVNALGIVATIGADYSFRRHVQGKGTEHVPIFSFRTQQLPVLHAIAAAHVCRAWQPVYLKSLTDTEADFRSRHGLGVVFKTTVCRIMITVAIEMGERIGAQGLFGHNLISQMEVSELLQHWKDQELNLACQNDHRGMAIAEGDIHVLCIRLFSELLLQRYSLPQPTHSKTLLSRHATGIFTRCLSVLSTLPKGHRDPGFNSLILPQSEAALTALGHALAYSAALDAGVPKPLLDIFELMAIRMDEAWYVENAGLTQANNVEMVDHAVSTALPHVQEYVDALNMRKYVDVPIQSDDTWDRWVETLRTHQREETAAADHHLAARL